MVDQFTWPRQAQYMVHFSSSSISSCHNIISISLLDLHYSGAINQLKRSLRGASQCEAVLALRLRLEGGVVGSVHVATPRRRRLRLRLRLGSSGVIVGSHVLNRSIGSCLGLHACAEV